MNWGRRKAEAVAIIVNKDIREASGDTRARVRRRLKPFNGVAVSAEIGDALDDSETSVAYSKASSDPVGTVTDSMGVDGKDDVKGKCENCGTTREVGDDEGGDSFWRGRGTGRVRGVDVIVCLAGRAGVDTTGAIDTFGAGGVRRCVAENNCSFSSFNAFTVASNCFLSSINVWTFDSKSVISWCFFSLDV